MGNLQQVVEGLHDVRIGAVGVFKVQTAVLLDVKALVFDVPAHSSALAGNGANISWIDPKIGHPSKGPFSFRAVFLTDESMDGMNAAFLVGMFQVVDPAKSL